MISISPGGIDPDIALGLEEVIRNTLGGGFYTGLRQDLDGLVSWR